MSYDGYQPYPKILYHATDGARRVEDESSHLALGAGWLETPVCDDAHNLAAPVAPKAKRGRQAKSEKTETATGTEDN